MAEASGEKRARSALDETETTPNPPAEAGAKKSPLKRTKGARNSLSYSPALSLPLTTIRCLVATDEHVFE
jgi:hypothetical protein